MQEGQEYGFSHRYPRFPGNSPGSANSATGVETVNYKYAFFTTLIVSGVITMASRSDPPQEKLRTPADGHDIHVLAPHMMDGKVMGPYHHYCKAVSPEVLECLIYESTEPNALLKQVEYFVAKNVSRSNVSLENWNKFYHDHAVEIATGRVQVLDRSPEEAKKIAEAAAQTDGIIFHLWLPDNGKAPIGAVGHPQSVGHKELTAKEYAVK
jgi:Protein of unknown function (DUF1264)